MDNPIYAVVCPNCHRHHTVNGTTPPENVALQITVGIYCPCQKSIYFPGGNSYLGPLEVETKEKP